jgi:FAD/FMN-containing dehydrogenase
MPRIAIETAVRYLPGTRDPLAAPQAWYLMLEVSSPKSQEDAEATIEAIFAESMERGLVEDGIATKSSAEAAALWRMREALSDLQKNLGGSIKHDVAVPLAAVPELLARAAEAATKLIPGARPFPFGHIGDGNIHLNISQPEGADKAAYLARWDEMNAAIHAIVLDLGGTISAEHGIGTLKRGLLTRVKSPVEIALMRKIKTALDPQGIMNPGKVL